MAYQAAITMVLRAHHISGAETNQCVHSCLGVETGKRWARAQKGMRPEMLRVFLVAPRTRGFSTNSERPYQANVQVTLQQAEGADTAAAMREFHLSPRSKLPEVQEEASAVAGATVAARPEWRKRG